jgi:hypothetical protein
MPGHHFQHFKFIHVTHKTTQNFWVRTLHMIILMKSMTAVTQTFKSQSIKTMKMVRRCYAQL